jgi:uncharacterized protein YfdQ (DUF2303 family)
MGTSPQINEEIKTSMGAELHAGETSDAAAIVSAVERLGQVDVFPADFDEAGKPGAPLVFAVPKGKNLVKAKPFLDELRDRPERRKGTATLLDLTSFIEHACRFKDEGRSALFAVRDPSAPKLISVLDYHDKGHASQPSFCAHRGVYEFPLSEEWKRWTRLNKEPMNQAVFAEFIESNALELLPPAMAGESQKDFADRLGVEFASPQQMMEVSRGLSAHTKDTYHQHVNLASGETAFSFASAHQDAQGQPLKVPAAFLIGLPVFKRGEGFMLAARLRYRVKDAQITWWYELWRHDVVFDTAVEEAAKAAQEGTGLPLFFGTPES